MVIEYWPPVSAIALPANVHAMVGSVDETVANLMIIFFDAASTVTFGSSATLGFTVAFASAFVSTAAAAAAAPAAALGDVTATGFGYCKPFYVLR